MRRIDSIIKTKFFAILLVLLLATGGVLLTRFSLAAAGQMYVSPGSSSVQNGNSFTVSLRINPGGSVDSVDARLSYDASKLQFISFDSGGSSFPGSVTETGGGGSVHVARFIGGGGAVTGDGLITRVTFKALAGSGSASLSLAGSNAAYQGAYTDPTLTAGTVSFTTPSNPPPPPPPPPPTSKVNPPPAKPGSSPPPSPTAKPGTTPAPTPGTPTPAPTTPAVAKANCTGSLKSVQFTVATLHVVCNPAARAFVKYGIDGKMVGATQPTAAGTEFDVNLSGTLIKPGTPVSFSVVGINSADEQTEGAAQTFTTRGYTVKIKALDKAQKPLAKRTFVLHSITMTAKSTADGTVTFTNVAPGQHTLELQEGKRKLSQAITVDDAVQVAADGTQYAGSQNYSLSFADAKAGRGVILWILGLFVVLLIGIAVWLLTAKSGGSLPPGLTRLIKKFSGQSAGAGPTAASPSSPGASSYVAQPPEVIKPQTQTPAAPHAEGKDTPSHAG